MGETKLKYRVKVEQTSPNFWVTDDDCISFPFHDYDDAFDLARMLNDTTEIEALKTQLKGRTYYHSDAEVEKELEALKAERDRLRAGYEWISSQITLSCAKIIGARPSDFKEDYPNSVPLKTVKYIEKSNETIRVQVCKLIDAKVAARKILTQTELLPAHPGCCDICDTGGCCKEESEEE